MAKRGRKPKQRDLEEAIDEADTAQAGHNSELTDAEKRALFFQHKKAYQAAIAVKKKADAALKNACKKAKAECGKDAVANIKDAIEFEAEDGRAKFNAEIARKQMVARWLGLPVGTEPSFFDMNDRTPSVDIAYDDGFADGAAGEPRKPNYDPSVPQHARYMEGYQDGQSALLSGISKLDTLPPEGEVEHADTSDAPFAPPADMPAAPAMPG